MGLLGGALAPPAPATVAELPEHQMWGSSGWRCFLREKQLAGSSLQGGTGTNSAESQSRSRCQTRPMFPSWMMKGILQLICRLYTSVGKQYLTSATWLKKSQI